LPLNKIGLRQHDEMGKPIKSDCRRPKPLSTSELCSTRVSDTHSKVIHPRTSRCSLGLPSSEALNETVGQALPSYAFSSNLATEVGLVFGCVSGYRSGLVWTRLPKDSVQPPWSLSRSTTHQTAFLGRSHLEQQAAGTNSASYRSRSLTSKLARLFSVPNLLGHPVNPHSVRDRSSNRF
jgi:hypothetical protein